MNIDRSCEPLSRKDKCVYWLYRLLPSGAIPYDWRDDWREYLRTRRF